MKYRAVILNFTKKTVDYVAPKDLPKPRKAFTTVSGSAPPRRRLP